MLPSPQSHVAPGDPGRSDPPQAWSCLARNFPRPVEGMSWAGSQVVEGAVPVNGLGYLSRGCLGYGGWSAPGHGRAFLVTCL